MATISLQCNSLSQIHSSAENSMTGRACIGKVMTQVWLISVIFDKQVNALKEKKFRGLCKLPQAHKKVCDEMKQTNKEENVIDGRKHFIGCI